MALLVSHQYLLSLGPASQSHNTYVVLDSTAMARGLVYRLKSWNALTVTNYGLRK